MKIDNYSKTLNHISENERISIIYSFHKNMILDSINYFSKDSRFSSVQRAVCPCQNYVSDILICVFEKREGMYQFYDEWICVCVLEMQFLSLRDLKSSAFTYLYCTAKT